MVEDPSLPVSVSLPTQNPQTSPEVISPIAQGSPRTLPPAPQARRDSTIQTNSEESLSPVDRAPQLQHPHQIQANQTRPASLICPQDFFPRLPSASLPEVRSYTDSNVGPPNPPKRQRTENVPIPSLKASTIVVTERITSLGGTRMLNSETERRRYQLLEKACQTEDLFYVALHQLFCIWDCTPDKVTQITGFPDNTVLQKAFVYVSTLIRDNWQLSPVHKKWFAAFPDHLSELLAKGEWYRNAVADVGIFLERLAADWDSLSYECGSRKYPPLVDELVKRLGLLSPILQGVVFTAARRNIGFTDGELGDRMESIFKQDQMEHQALAVRFNTSRPATEQEVETRNQNLATEYLRAFNHLIEQRPSSSLLDNSANRLPTSVIPSNSQFQSRAQQQQLSSRYQSMSKPAGSRQQSTAPEQYQSVPQPSAGPGYPNVIAQQSQSASQRVHHNTPSPTLLQGLTVNSPLQPGFQFRTTNFRVPPQQHNGLYYSGPASNGTYQQIPPPMDSSRASVEQMSRMSPQQIGWVQQQQSHLVLQQHQQLQQPRLTTQSFNGQAQMELQQQPHSPVQQMQMQQQQQILNQGLASLGRATARREGNGSVGMPQSIPSRTNSVSSGGRQTPNAHMLSAPARSLVPVGVLRNETPLSYEQTLQANITKYNSIPPLRRPLLPPLNYVQPSQPTNPELTALHQAHLRSPRLVAANGITSETAQNDPDHRYYQAVKRFALPPTKIHSSAPMSKYDFSISAVDFSLTLDDSSEGNGQVATRKFQNYSLQYRLRCIQMKKTANKFSTSEWVVHDTVWPESVSIDINKKYLDIRRKSHHGKDLPVDITSLIRGAGPESINRISVSITRGRSKFREFNYFIGVEIIEILSHAEVVHLCSQRHIPAGHTLESIKKSLAGPASDDDDFAMVVSDLSIDLADPFTARIFEIPVRGSSCLHRECFDLKTFLLTRNSKPKRPEQPCMIDVWKCPLCAGDARPYSLQIDDFLASVRASLASQGLLEVKAIWIAPDGTWRPKVEERSGTADHDDSDDSSDGEAMRKQRVTSNANQVNKSKRPIEVIELDDD
jgi:hypothetical protein